MTSTPPRPPARVLLLALLLALAPLRVARASVDRAHAKGKAGPRFGTSSRAFFDGGANALAHDDDFLTSLTNDDAAAAPIEDASRVSEAFAASGDVASFLRVRPVRSVRVPIPVAFVMVGFDGDGHLGLHLSEDDQVRWFQRIDRAVSHARVPRAALERFRRRGRRRGGGEGGEEETTTRHRRATDDAAEDAAAAADDDGDGGMPASSFATYDFRAHVVNPGPGVLEVFERAIETFARPVDPPRRDGDGAEKASATRSKSKSNSRSSTSADDDDDDDDDGRAPDPDAPVTHHVDAHSMSSLVDSLVDGLGLGEGYAVVVLNPKKFKAFGDGRYGYRAGFSPSEMAALRPRADALRKEARRRGGPRRRAPSPAPEASKPSWWIENVLAPREGAAAGGGVVAYDASKAGARWAKKAARAVADAAAEPAGASHPLDAAALRVLTGDDAHAAKRLSAALAGAVDDDATDEEDDGDASASDSVSDETDCVSDLYVGRERASWIDLGAGPFAWGPLVGGSGLRGATDLPDVDLRFNRGLSDAEKAAHRPTPDARLREELEAAAAESEASIDPRDELQVFRAQMDVYTSFAKKHCESRATRIKLCDDLKRKTRELSVAIAEAKDGDVQPEDADFSLFGRDDLPPNVTIARDVFASELGRVLSSHLTRVVAPANAPGPRRYHERVHVTVYFVAMGASDPSRSPYGTDAFGGFDVEKFESEARGLMLRDQKLEFSAQRLRVPRFQSRHTSTPFNSASDAFQLHPDVASYGTTLSASDDAAVAAALASSLRTGADAVLTEGGDVATRKTRWIDARELRRQLVAVGGGGGTSAAGPRGAASVLEIPVFVVEPEVDDRAPLLVDGAHQAVSMPDMIIATQSHDARYASSFACDGAATRVNLRDPTKAAVLALAEHLGGALPTHLGADRSRSDRGVIGVEEEWLWSVGSHPLSSTCAFGGGSLTRTQKDVVHRAYALTAVDAAAAAVNAGVKTLRALKTTGAGAGAGGVRGRGEDGLKALRSAGRHATDALRAHARVAEGFQTLAEAMERLDFDAVAAASARAERDARAFRDACEEIAAAMRPGRCTRRRRVDGVGGGAAGVIVLAVVAVVIVHGLRSEKLKPKIN